MSERGNSKNVAVFFAPPQCGPSGAQEYMQEQGTGKGVHARALGALGAGKAASDTSAWHQCALVSCEAEQDAAA